MVGMAARFVVDPGDARPDMPGARPALFIRKWFGDGAYEFAIRRMAR